MSSDFDALIVLLTIIFFSFFSFYKKLLSRDGIFFANIFGIAVYFLGGLKAFTTILLFFSIAEIATMFGRSNFKPHGKRDVGNIIGNGMPALVALLLGSTMGFYGGISAALSDTMSSEIGLISKKKPRLITNLNKEVPRGTDGGITLLGLFAGIIGAFLIGFTFFLFNLNEYTIWISSLGFFIIFLSGFTGCIIDSLLGAVFETKGLLNNTWVNFLSSSSSAFLANFLWYSLFWLSNF
ncbi:MAG: DUF92 domain-containing protein [Candidatus Diapherotrites archaeon]|nr:DUF92 domain-containing protein [Candidatus Diapherotrites archaeon]